MTDPIAVWMALRLELCHADVVDVEAAFQIREHGRDSVFAQPQNVPLGARLVTLKDKSGGDPVAWCEVSNWDTRDGGPVHLKVRVLL